MKNAFPTIQISGTKEEAAQQTAEQLGPMAHKLLQFREDLLPGMLPEGSQMPSEPFWKQLYEIHLTSTHYSAIESKAFAEKLGKEPGYILAMSGMSDFLDYMFFSGQGELGCSTLSLPKEISPELGFVQTWDLHLDVEKYSIVMHRQVEGCYASICLTTALGHGHFGVNEHGICVGTNNLQCLHPRPGVVFAAAIQEVLDSASTAQEALEIFSKLPFMSGHNFIVAAPDSPTLNIEQSTKGIHVTPVEQKCFPHTNHYLHPPLQAFGRMYSTSSQPRYQFLLEASKKLSPDANLANFKRIFSDHTAPICRHTDDPTDAATCGLIAFHPRQRQLSIIKGRVCQGEWETYTL